MPKLQWSKGFCFFYPFIVCVMELLQRAREFQKLFIKFVGVVYISLLIQIYKYCHLKQFNLGKRFYYEISLKITSSDICGYENAIGSQLKRSYQQDYIFLWQTFRVISPAEWLIPDLAPVSSLCIGCSPA